MTDETATLAVNIARNCGWCVLPCRDDKRPASPHGFKDAVCDPDAVARLWRDHPGPLIGIATGAVSGFDLLDLDLKHDPALGWWRSNQHRIPATRTYRSRSGGLHLHLIHAPGLGCSAGRLAPGVDVRADGGYAINWFAAGFPCLDHTPPAPWPAWLLAELIPKRKPTLHPSRPIGRGRSDCAIDGALQSIATATEGQRNTIVHWAACRLGERVHAGHIGAGEAETLLISAGIAAGLAEREVRATVRSGLRRAG